MSNKINFELHLRDLMSTGLNKIKGNSSKVFGEVDKDVKGLKRGLNDLEKPVKFKFDTHDIDLAGEKLKKLHSNNMGFMKTAGAMALGGFFQQGISNATGKLREFAHAGLKVGMEMEKNIVGLSTFVGEENARKVVNRVVNEGVNTPFTTAQLLPIERGLIAMGLNMDRAHKDTWSLANAIAGTGGSDATLDRMGWHMTQAAARGKVDGMIMREFSTAGIPINKLLQSSLPELKGLSNEKAMDKLEKMTVSYDMVSEALFKASQSGGMFANAQEKLSQTISGKWSTLMDKLDISSWRLTESQAKNIKHLEDRMIGFADNLPKLTAGLANDLDIVFKRFDEIAPSAGNLGSAFADALNPVKDFLLGDNFANLSKSVLDFTSTLVKDVTPAIKDLAFWANRTAGGVGKELKFFTSLLDFQNLKFFGKPDGSLQGLTNYMKAGNIMHGLSFGLWGGTAFQSNKKTTQQYPNRNIGAGYMMGFGVAPGLNSGKAGNDNNGGMGEFGKSIIGGGKQQININFRNFVEHIHNQFTGRNEALQWSEHEFEGMLARVLGRISGA